MSIAFVVVAVIAYLALASAIGSRLRRARKEQTRPVQLEAVRDEQLDITPALRRSR